jgi:hypothetical protein
MDAEILEPCSLLCLSASATTPGRHFAAGAVASFAEGRTDYREWARRNGRLGDIHSLDDRYDHDVDELMALTADPPNRADGARRSSAPSTLSATGKCGRLTRLCARCSATTSAAWFRRYMSWASNRLSEQHDAQAAVG